MHTDEVAKAQAEEYLAELQDDEFAAVVKRVRAPRPRPPRPDPNQGRVADPVTSPQHEFTTFITGRLNGDHS